MVKKGRMFFKVEKEERSAEKLKKIEKMENPLKFLFFILKNGEIFKNKLISTNFMGESEIQTRPL